MNNKKGFAPMLVIVIIIALALIGGGAYYLGTKNSTPENVAKDDGQIGDLLDNLQGNNLPQDNQNDVVNNPVTTSTTTTTTTTTDCLPTTAPWIKVISPNGGETYTAGQKITVKWKSCNVQPTYFVNVVLRNLSNNHLSVRLTEHENPNDGIQDFIIPLTTTSGQYKVEVETLSSEESNGIADSSDNLFTINPQQTSTVKSIKVLYPNKGEVIELGKSYTIKWSTVGFSSSDNVDISLKDDSIYCPPASSGMVGCQNQFYIARVKNTGSYTWNTDNKMSGPSTGPNSISVYAGNNFKMNIFISSTNNPSLSASDYSDKVFTINIQSEYSLVPVNSNPYISNMTNLGPMTGTLSYFLVKKNIDSNNTMHYYDVYSDIFSQVVSGERYIKDGKIYYNPTEQSRIVEFGGGISANVGAFRESVNQEINKNSYAIIEYSSDTGPYYINYTLIK